MTVAFIDLGPHQLLKHEVSRNVDGNRVDLLGVRIEEVVDVQEAHRSRLTTTEMVRVRRGHRGVQEGLDLHSGWIRERRTRVRLAAIDGQRRGGASVDGWRRR